MRCDLLMAKTGERVHGVGTSNVILVVSHLFLRQWCIEHSVLL